MIKRISIVLALLFSVLVLFQNCAPGDFELTKLNGNVSNTIQSSVDITVANERQAYNGSVSQVTFDLKNMNAAQVKFIGCNWDSKPVFDCTNKVVSLNSLSDGDHILSIAIESHSGPTFNTTELFRVDRTAPVVSLLSTPSPTSQVSSGSISFNAIDATSGVSKIECAIDNSPFALCSSPFTYANLSEGNHELKIKATDRAENTKDPIVFSWKVNSLRPTINITQFPNPITNIDTATFAFTGTNAARFECNFNGQGFQTCVSPKVYPSLAQGSYTFVAQAVSESGNVSQPAEVFWSVDKTPPTITLSGTPSSLTNSTTAQFTFSGNRVNVFECSLDGASYSNCTSPKSYASLSNGVHNFKLRGVSAAGNYSTESTHQWTIETSASPVTITQNPPSLTNQTSATFSFSGVGISSYQCSLDAASFATCTSPKSYSGLVEGDHSFQVKGTSAAGNTSGVTTYNWRVETTKPTITITSNPDALSTSPNATFQFTSNNAARFECQLNNSPAVTCSSPKTYSGLANGDYDFKVKAISAAGNISNVATFSWKLNSTPPTVTLASVPANFTKLTSVSVSFTGSNAARFECKMDTGTYAACVSPFNYNNVDQGLHTFTVRAFNSTNLVSNESMANWVFDSVVPSLPTITLDVTNPTSKADVQVNFSSTDANGIDHYDCALDNEAPSVCTSPKLYTGLSSGTRKVTIIAYDKAGNSKSNSESWLVDTQQPGLSFTSNTPSSFASMTFSDTETFNFSASDGSGSGIDNVFCKLDTQTETSCIGGSISYSGLAPGAHVVNVRAIDKVGLEKSISFSWTYSDQKLLPEYNLTRFTEAPTYLLQQMNLSGTPKKGYGYLTSACGVYKIANNGATIERKDFKVPGLINSVGEVPGKIWVGTPLGLFLSTDDGATFTNKLDAAKATTILNTQTVKPLPCGSMGITRLSISEVFASPSLVVAKSGSLIFVSQDDGDSFVISRFYRDEGQINPPFLSNSLYVKGSEIIVGTSDSPSPSMSIMKTGQSTCSTTPNDANPMGIFISNDSGKTFKQINNTGAYHRSVVRSNSQTNVLLTTRSAGVQFLGDVRTLHRSTDNGATFTKHSSSLVVSTGGELDANTQRNLFSEVNGALFFNRYRDYTTGSTLLKTTDAGANWSEVVIDSGIPADQLGSSTSIALSNNDLAVATNAGVYISNDSGASFSKVHKFDSNFCAYPWWQADSWGDIASDSGKIYVTMASDLRSIDGGASFKSWNQFGGGTDIFTSNSGNTIVMAMDISAGQGFKVSTNAGETFASAVSSFTDPNNNHSYSVISGSGHKDIYVSTDDQNHAAFLTGYYASKSYGFYGAISSGNRIVATTRDSILAFENGLLENRFITGNGLGIMKIRKIDSTIFVLDESLWMSTDFGRTFAEVTDGPYRPYAIWKNGSVIQTSSLFDGLKESADGGVTWKSVSGTMKTETR